MSSIPNSLLQIQLETTLQMVMLSSSTMTANQLVDYRVRLTEASVVLGYVLAQRNEHDSNGTFTCILSSLLLSFETDNRHHHSAGGGQHTAPPPNTSTANGNPGGRSGGVSISRRETANHQGTDHPAPRVTARRPVTQSTARNPPSSRRRGDTPVPVIEIGSDDEPVLVIQIGTDDE